MRLAPLGSRPMLVCATCGSRWDEDARPAISLPAALCPMCEGALLELCEVAHRRPVRLDRAVALGERGVALGDGALALEVGCGALVERLVAGVERGRALAHGPVALLDDGVVIEVGVGARLVAGG